MRVEKKAVVRRSRRKRATLRSDIRRMSCVMVPFVVTGGVVEFELTAGLCIGAQDGRKKLHGVLFSALVTDGRRG
jgi:hypothetical protein